MPGDWIPMRSDLHEDPKVIAIASALGLDVFAVIGRLLKLWGWVSRKLPDGSARGITQEWIDDYVRADGFAEAMASVGWLSINNNVCIFPELDTWNSASAKARRSAASRMRKARRKSTTNVAPTAQPTQHESEHGDRSLRDAAAYVESPVPTEPGSVDSYGSETEQNDPLPEGFEDFWDRYPRQVGRPEALQAFRDANIEPELLTQILSHLAVRQIDGNWMDVPPAGIPSPADFLRKRRWTEEYRRLGPDGQVIRPTRTGPKWADPEAFSPKGISACVDGADLSGW